MLSIKSSDFKVSVVLAARFISENLATNLGWYQGFINYNYLLQINEHYLIVRLELLYVETNE